MKKRSASYPSKTLFETENFSVSVFQNIGDAIPLKYPDLAKHGNVAVREADSFASTASQYGWMKNIRGKGYAPIGEKCKALRTPKDGEKNKLLLDAFVAPPIYKTIIHDWNNKTITQDGLEIYLVRDKDFSDIGAKVGATVFLTNAKSLGLLNQDNILNVDAEIKIEASSENQKKHQQAPSKKTGKNILSNYRAVKNPIVQEKNETKIPTPSGALKTLHFFVRGTELKFQVLEDMNQSDWDAIIKQIQNIKAFAK